MAERRSCCLGGSTKHKSRKKRFEVAAELTVQNRVLNIYTTHWNINKFCISLIEFMYGGARGSVIGTGLQARSSRVRFRIMSMGFFQWQLPSGRILALSLNKRLTEMSTKKFHGVKVASF